MTLSRFALATLGLSLALGFTSAARAAEDAAAALAKAPAAVQAAAKKYLGDKKLEEFDKEIVGDKTQYEIGYKVDSVDHAYILDEAGKLVQEEADFEVAKLPSAVTDTVKKTEPKGEVKEAADATANGKHFFVIDVQVDKDLHVLSVNTDGSLISDQIEKSAAEAKD